MRRQAIDDGGWIDLDTAAKYGEETHFDGSNHISDATGSQWDHEALWCSRSGVYVLHHWSQWQGSRESWTRLSAEDAAAWLVRNGHDAPTPELKAAIASLEV